MSDTNPPERMRVIEQLSQTPAGMDPTLMGVANGQFHGSNKDKGPESVRAVVQNEAGLLRAIWNSIFGK